MDNKIESHLTDRQNTLFPNSRISTANLSLPNYTVTHQNRLQIELDKLQSTSSQIPEIVNFSAVMHQSKVLKVIEIRFKGRLIKIQDSFAYTPHTQPGNLFQNTIKQQTPVPCNNELIVCKQRKETIVLNQRKNHRQMNTKNVVKNIFKIFQSWADIKTPFEIELKVELEEILKKNQGKFNNRLLLDSFNYSLIRKAFLVFSERAAEKMIAQSKIANKASHIEILSNYHRICQQIECFQGGKMTKQTSEDDVKQQDSIEPIVRY